MGCSRETILWNLHTSVAARTDPLRSSEDPEQMDSVRAFIEAALRPDVKRRIVHEEFTGFEISKFPSLWRWIEVNLRVTKAKGPSPNQWTVGVRDRDLVSDGELVHRSKVAEWLRYWALCEQNPTNLCQNIRLADRKQISCCCNKGGDSVCKMIAEQCNNGSVGWKHSEVRT